MFNGKLLTRTKEVAILIGFREYPERAEGNEARGRRKAQASSTISRSRIRMGNADLRYTGYKNKRTAGAT
jgi:hypothetical protein